MEELTPFRYRGYYYDTETELYYLQTRYYDPETGRFLSADGISYLNAKISNGLNLYAYCRNNPVIYIDDNGRKPEVNIGVDIWAIFNKNGSVWYSGRHQPQLILNNKFNALIHNLWQTILGPLEGKALNWNLTVGALSDSGFTALSVGGSLFEGRIYNNSTDYFGLILGSATLSIFDFSFSENFKFNLLEAQATILTVGVYSQYVDAEVLIGSVGAVLKFENSALTIGFSLGWGIKITIRFW